jgi:uncharacterized membrane protein
VLQNTLPPLQQQYPQELVVATVNVTEPQGRELYLAMVDAFQLPDERLGVPALVIGDQVLVGSQEIPEQFPGLIQSGLAGGGVAWPNLAGLAQYTQSLEPASVSLDEPIAESTGAPDDEPTGLLERVRERYLRDVAGNTLAVVVLLGMLASLVLVAYNFVMGDPDKIKPWPGWVIPLLTVVGMGIAAYLTFVETTKTSAICGPIGDCNSVQQSPYAMILGILPVGVLGLLGYAAILALWVVQRFSSEKIRRLAWFGLWGLSIFGVLFSIYLTFLEPFVIGATCIWCISSAIIMTLLLWATTPLARLAAGAPEELAGE